MTLAMTNMTDDNNADDHSDALGFRAPGWEKSARAPALTSDVIAGASQSICRRDGP